MQIDLDTVAEQKTRWLDLCDMDHAEDPERARECGGVHFLIRCMAPKEAQKLRSDMQAKGIIQKDSGLPNPGREDAWFLAIARAYVLDWSGGGFHSADPEKRKYSPERMAYVLANRPDVNTKVQEAIADYEAFFIGNGRPRTSN